MMDRAEIMTLPVVACPTCGHKHMREFPYYSLGHPEPFTERWYTPCDECNNSCWVTSPD